MRLFLIILAAGNSSRLKSRIPKPYIRVKNRTLLEYSIDAFKDFKSIKKTIVVYKAQHKKYMKKLNLQNTTKIIGGNLRQDSVFKALKKIKSMNCKKVLIHDAARPSPSKKLIENLIKKLKNNDAVIPIIKTNDAAKRVEKDIIFKNIQKNNLRFAQTPQGFSFKKIFNKHREKENSLFDDDSALFTKNDEKVLTIKGSKLNLKITDEDDLKIFKFSKKEKLYSGIGFDVHKLIKGKTLYLGGVKIPFKLGLEGHSDGDPVIHALIDSLLGACRLGDIGKFFSNKDKKYKNIRSTILLQKIIKLIKADNYIINNIDINIIAQKPKIKKYIKQIQKKLSLLCEIKPDQINVKGKTTEKLGLIGKEKAIASEIISTVINND